MNAVWMFREKIVMFSRSPHDLKFDLSRRSQDENGKKNLSKCKMHVQGVQSFFFLPTKYANLWRSRSRCRSRCLRSLLSFSVVVEFDDQLTSPSHPLFVGKHALKG